MPMETVICRQPQVSDGAKIWELIVQCKPLDENSAYLYLLLCRHFADTCLVAEIDKKIVGFVSGYVPADEPDAIFIWQIAIDPNYRGQGMGKHLLNRLLQQKACINKQKMLTTISPSNKASQRLFQSLAEDIRADITTQPFFSANDFPKSGAHEEEVLYCLTPRNHIGNDVVNKNP